MTLRQKRITKKVVIYIVLVIMTIASLFLIFFCLSKALDTGRFIRICFHLL